MKVPVQIGVAAVVLVLLARVFGRLILARRRARVGPRVRAGICCAACAPPFCFTMTMLLVCAHASSSLPGPPPAGPPTEFSRLVDEYFEAAFAFSPSGGTAVGLHAYDRALEDLSRARAQARAAEVHAFVARLGRCPSGPPPRRGPRPRVPRCHRRAPSSSTSRRCRARGKTP